MCRERCSPPTPRDRGCGSPRRARRASSRRPPWAGSMSPTPRPPLRRGGGGGRGGGTDYLVIDDRREAVGEAIRLATTGDTVVLAGKGHEGSIIVGEEKRPYDEATVARDALRSLGFGS